MRRTVALLILVAIVSFVIFLCRPEPEPVVENPDSTPEEIALARRSGREAGLAVGRYREGSMDREGAILEIRARETEIRTAGFTIAADTFAAAAAAAMREKGII